MSSTKIYYLALSIGFALALLGLLVVLFSPKTNSTQFYLSNTKNLNPTMVKIVNLLGGDIMSLIPKDVQKRSIASKEVDEVFKSAGNPWEVTKLEFHALRLAYAFVGITIGVIFSYLTNTGFMFGLIIVGIMGFLGLNRPLSVYRKIASTREADFKKHFPELLDYLTMIMGHGSYTLANAIETAVPYLPESTVKDEFEKVVDSINAGMNTENALLLLSNRIPTPALQSFVQAINNANKLNTPMEDLMKTRAKQSREDLLNEIELIIQGLPTKTMLTTAPFAILSILLIALVPVFASLLGSL